MTALADAPRAAVPGVCHSLAEAFAAGCQAGLAMPPLSQETADLVAAILASVPERPASAA